MSIEDNLRDIERIFDLGARSGAEVALGMAISFVCPYEGLVPEPAVMSIVERAVRLGIRDISLSDSIGLAWPQLVGRRCRAVLDRWPEVRGSASTSTRWPASRWPTPSPATGPVYEGSTGPPLA